MHQPVAFCAGGAAGPLAPDGFPARRRPRLPGLDTHDDVEGRDPAPLWRLPSPVPTGTTVIDHLLAHPRPLIGALETVLAERLTVIAQPSELIAGEPGSCQLLGLGPEQELTERSEMIIGDLIHGFSHYEIVAPRLAPAARQAADTQRLCWEAAVPLPLHRQVVQVRAPAGVLRAQRIVLLHHRQTPVALVREVVFLPTTGHPASAS